MQETAETGPLQLLFIELRVGLARSAIQAALLLNGGASVALLLFLANLPPPAAGALPVNLVLLKWASAVFGVGLFIPGMTFVKPMWPRTRSHPAAQAHSATPCDDWA
jgi:hypothetical protein